MTSKNLTLPANNTYVGTWDVPVNTNFSGVDYALGSVTYISVTGQSGIKAMVGTYSSTYPYTPNGIGSYGAGVTSSPSYIPPVISITGTLTASVNYQLPAGVCGQWSVYNGTSVSVSGSTVSFSIAGGNSVVIDNSKRRLIVSDGINVNLANSPSDAQGTDGSLQFNNSNTYYGSSLRYIPSSGAFTLSPLTFTGVIDGSGNLTTTGSQPLSVDMVIKNAAGTALGTVVSGSGTTWVLGFYTATASSTMYAYPSSANAGVALTINSYDNQYGQQIIAGTTAGQSKGLLIKAGTNASDYSLRITDSATTPADRFSIDGYGAVTIAAPSASSALFSLSVNRPVSTTSTGYGAIKCNGSGYTPTTVLTWAATLTIDASLSNVFRMTFGAGNIVTLTINNAQDGQTITWLITQDSTGSRTITWPSNFRWEYGTAQTLSTTGGKTDVLNLIYAGGYFYATLIPGF